MAHAANEQPVKSTYFFLIAVPFLLHCVQQADGSKYYCPEGWCDEDEYCCGDGTCCKLVVDNWHISVIFGLLFILIMAFGMWILYRRWRVTPKNNGYVHYPHGYTPIISAHGSPVFAKQHRPKFKRCSQQPEDPDYYPTTEPWTQYHVSEDPIQKPHPIPSQYRTPQYETTLQQASSFYNPSSVDESPYQRTPTAPPPSP